MKILALSHSLWFGGAQISNVEFFNLLRKLTELKVLVCNNISTESGYITNFKNIETYRVPCNISMSYPIMDIKKYRKLIEWADVIWITDTEYRTAPRIREIRRTPIVAHLHSYVLICPWGGVLYGYTDICVEKCSPWRIIRCKQNINLELAKIGLLSTARASIYWLLDFTKGPLEYFKWTRIAHDAIESINGFVPVSKALWDIHTSHMPEFKDKPFRVIYNLATEPLKYVKPIPNEPYENYILYASGPSPSKGSYILLKAWSKVSKEFKELKLYMVRCKDSWLEEKARKMNLRNIVFMEKLPPNIYYYLMYKAKAVIMPSIWPEPFGRIPVEANRLGVPAVVTNRGALPEIIENGVTGVVSEAEDNSLAEAIATVVSRDWDRGKIIKSTSRRLNPRDIVLRLLKFFERVSSMI